MDKEIKITPVKQKKKTVDMTVGAPLRVLLTFAVPLIFGSLLQQLYSFADSAIVGNFISNDALTAVGVTSSVTFLVQGITMGASIGFSIPISQSVGANDRTEINKSFWNGLYLTVLIGALFSLLTPPLVRPLLVLLNTSESLIDMSAQYLTVIMIGQLAVALYNYLAGTIRAFGDSKTPFLFLLLACILNILLDLLFVTVIPLGVIGAAAATVISQIVSAALCLLLIVKRKMICAYDENGEALYKISLPHVKRIAIIGLPLGIEYSVCSIGNVTLQRSINILGDVYATAQYCGDKIRSIATIPMESVGTAMATYSASNLGSGKIDRIRSGVKCGLLIQISYCVIAYLGLLLLKRPLVYLLLGNIESEAAVLSVEYISIISLLFVFHGSLMIFRNTVQGMGYGISTLASSAMEIIGRTLAGIIAVSLGSFTVICISAPMAWILAGITCLTLYLHYIKISDSKLEKAKYSDR